MLDNDVDDLYLTFSYDLDACGQRHLVELVPDGANIFVTNANKKIYVKLLCLTKMREEMSDEIDAFLRGFNTLISASDLAYFTPSEIETIIAGRSTIDVQDMKKYANLGYGYSDEYLSWFWEVLEEFSESERSAFLYFVSGSTKISHGGFASFPLRVNYWGSSTQALPVAHTW